MSQKAPYWHYHTHNGREYENPKAVCNRNYPRYNEDCNPGKRSLQHTQHA